MLFIGKNTPVCIEAGKFVKRKFNAVVMLDPPEFPYVASKEVIISFLSPYIVPQAAITGLGINFHPGPPEYPGIGCTNFALYNGAKEYGVTCHHMSPVVDSGPIIEVRRFPIVDDTVESLTERTHAYLLVLFYDIMNQLGNLPKSSAKWAVLTSRSDLNRLSTILPLGWMKTRHRGVYRLLRTNSGNLRLELRERSMR